jgi:DNA-binding response OmpR family regulator
MVAKIILAADGSDDARIRYSTFLQFGGFVVLEARTGAEAVELLRTEPAAALVVALRPVGAGLELLERLRAEGGDARVPVLLLADDDSTEGRARAASAGCAAYLLRPCPPHELLQALCAVIDRGAHAGPAHGETRDPVNAR